jgi:hypothetical protein
VTAHRIVEALLANGDDPKDYIDQTLPDDRYIIVHAKHPEDYFIDVSNPEDPRLTFERSGATVLKLDDAQRICADINSSTGEEDRYIVLPVEHDVVEALLGDDDFDPNEEAVRSLGSVTRDQVFDWLADIGMTDYHSHPLSLNSKNYFEVRGTMTGSHSAIEEKLFHMAERWNLTGQMKWAIDAHSFAQPIPRAVQVIIPSNLITPG